MTTITGRVTDIAINWNKSSFEVRPDGKPAVGVTLFSDDPNTHTIPQMQLATRSWMLAVLQTAFTSGNPLTVKYDDANQAQQIGVELPPLKINPDLIGHPVKTIPNA